MLTKIYRWILKLTSRPGEKGEYSGGYLQDLIRKEALSLCRHAKGRLLEIGCGEGLFLAQITEQNSKLEVWGVDNDDARLKAAALKARGVNLSRRDAASLSFEDGYFDAVICINVLFNMRSIDDVKRTLKEMKRVCKRDGSMIFDFRNSLNPLLSIKYRLARYYDDTLKGLSLKTYSPEEIGSVLKELDMAAVKKRFIGLNSRFLAAAVVVEAKNI
jgi:ubiquinone/menaquinone biosynthesis C-methylase UbiE